jgi:hypothetical protein
LVLRPVAIDYVAAVIAMAAASLFQGYSQTNTTSIYIYITKPEPVRSINDPGGHSFSTLTRIRHPVGAGPTLATAIHGRSRVGPPS